MTKHYNGPKKKRPSPLMWFVNYVIQNRGDVLSEAWMVESYFRWYPFDEYGAYNAKT